MLIRDSVSAGLVVAVPFIRIPRIRGIAEIIKRVELVLRVADGVAITPVLRVFERITRIEVIREIVHIIAIPRIRDLLELRHDVVELCHISVIRLLRRPSGV